MDPYQEFLWRQTMRMYNNGATPAQIADYLQIAERNNLRGLIMGPNTERPEYPGLARGLAQQVIQGATFGFGDEALGTLAGMFSKKYTTQEGRDLMRAQMDEFERVHPKASIAANLVGGAATLAIPGAAALGTGGKMAAAGVGAGAGALAGAGAAEGNLAERLPEAAQGGAIGAVAGPVISAGISKVAVPVVGSAARAASRAVPETFRKRIQGMIAALPGSPQRASISTVAEGLDADGLSPTQLAATIRQRADAGIPTPLSSVVGDHTMAVFESAMDFRTPEQQAFATRIATVGINAGDRLTEMLGSGTRVGLQNARQLARVLKADRTLEADPHYADAFQRMVTLGAKTRQLLADPKWREIYEAGRQVAVQEDAAGLARGLQVPQIADDLIPDQLPVRALDYMKKGIDALTDRQGADGRPVMNRAMARAFRARLGGALEEIDTAVPSYAEGRRIWGGYSEMLDGIEEGMTEFLKMAPEEVTTRLRTHPQPDAWRIGAIQSVADVVHGARGSAKDVERFFGANLFGAQDRTQLRRIQALFPDEQVAMEFADRVAGEAASVHGIERLGGRATPNPARATAALEKPPGVTRRVARKVGLGQPNEDRQRLVANEITRLNALGLDNPYELADVIESIPAWRTTTQRLPKAALRSQGAAQTTTPMLEAQERRNPTPR